MALTLPALEPGRNCWRLERAEHANVIVDAADYFGIVRSAMCDAKRQLMLVGWDFDARMNLVYDADDGVPETVGAFIDWLIDRDEDLHIYILRWDTGAMHTLFRGLTVLKLIRWWRHPRIHFMLDAHHPFGASHHQKIVVIDDSVAFCGGIDMTADRWDTREHIPFDERRKEPDGTYYTPWHDATTALAGPVAKALGDLCRDRWRDAGGGAIDAPDRREPFWPDELPSPFSGCEVAISRTLPEMTNQPPVHEIEQLYCDLIARAERWIYAESQYFASRKIAEAMAKRLEEEDGPEIVIVNPVTAEGWLEPIAMDTARARLVQSIRHRDKYDRFRVYHAENDAGEDIYIHAKVTVIDGEILRVGSSNFNNRSMRLDTECDVTIDTTRPANRDHRDAVAAVAHDLIAEHTVSDADEVARTLEETGSLIATIERLCGSGRRLRRYRTPNLNEVERWLADNEVLDPENPDEMFDVTSRRGGLFRGLPRVPERIRPHDQEKTLAVGAVAAVAAIGFAFWRKRRRRG